MVNIVSVMSGDGASVPWEQAIALLSDFRSQAEQFEDQGSQIENSQSQGSFFFCKNGDGSMPFEALPKSENVIVLGLGFQRVIHKQHY